MSTAEIGRRLGISKISVVGKAHRLELPARPSPIKNRGPRPLSAPRIRRPAETVPVAKAPQPQQQAAPKPAKLVAVPVQGTGGPCQWPHGHPGQAGFHFCGEASLPGKPYCAEHAARAYVSAKSRSEAAA